MRKLGTLLLLTLAMAVPSYAVGKSQSYFTYDDGGTIVRQADNGEEIDGRVNLPLYSGDEVATSRRGRSEIRLSDGNVLGVDRSTDVHFRSLLDSYDGNDPQTIVELRFGHVIIERTPVGREALRIDTDSASYIAYDEAIYAVESDGRGKDRVTVFDGAVEIRTPNRTSRLREGEQAQIDNNGIYGLVSDSQVSADDFERWFLKRAERDDHGSSKYLDRSLAYSDYDLAQNGNWIYINGYGWSWRPNVAAGWRPYYNGEWMYGRGGCLTWVSYEPWGWVPYHYGRWAYDPVYGWVWLPGTGYAPAWVYWMYGPGYVGWAPAGWYDCYQPYYNWCYRGAARASLDAGFGFFGNIRLNEVDLRPWTFVAPGQIVSTRVDRAALTTDAVRNRLVREGGTATVTNSPARFTRNELKDPAMAVNNVIRRGTGSGTGTGSAGSPAGATDLTPFFRRDPELSTAVRERIARNNGGSGSPNGGTTTASSTPRDGGSSTTVNRGGLAPIGGGSLAPIGGGGLAPIAGGSVAPIDGGRISRGGNAGSGTSSGNGSTGAGTTAGTTGSVDTGSIRRGGDNGSTDGGGRVRRGDEGSSRDRESGGSGSTPWRDRIGRPVSAQPGNPPATPTAGSSAPAPSSDEWRGRGGMDRGGAGSNGGSTGESAAPSSRGSDVPR
ncbi:MAG: FecR domain-containing protein, partial [Acidobacteria bacterium]|nr:FecR domain-containing protein [Acidobacteriota bacterium]